MTDAPRRSALVITASDGTAAGVREDTSGARVQARLEALGFVVERRLVPDDAAVIEYAVPGLAEAMRAAGRASTPLADLSRGVVGVHGRSLIVNLPGSPKGALESLEALVPVLDHALETLAGPYDHGNTPEGG